nr:MAG TPA: hypothetical protein [Caudoviricetes sp.]
MDISKVIPTFAVLKTSAECYPYRELRLMLTKYDGLFYVHTDHFSDVRKMIYTK